MNPFLPSERTAGRRLAGQVNGVARTWSNCLLERGADPIEADAEPWVRLKAWAQQRGHTHFLALLDG
jgi:hypothetical protein